ncbi:MAG TPA: ATP-binding protein [Thermoanaerobaculia bacterium]|jgi:signal transduction histidine kinase|nr:ATP-binding protein [Thermoanaerobaculia bacterium]
MNAPVSDSTPRSGFGLRGKLALGFAGLLALLFVVSAQSISMLERLGGSIDVILRENYRSVIAAQEMKDALERIDSGTLFALAGDADRGRALVELQHPRFEKALKTELGNITIAGERERAERVRDLFTTYTAALPQVLDDRRPAEARSRIYFAQLLPRFQEIKRGAEEILQLNQTNMVEANDRARALAAAARSRMILLLAAGAALAILLVAFLSQAILGPLSRLTESAREIERGHLDLVVPVAARDELGQLAEAFNAMAGSLRELRRSDQAKLLRAQKTSQLAIDSLPDAVALLSPEGGIELANRTAIAEFGLAPGAEVPERHSRWLRPLLANVAQASQASRFGAAPERGFEAAIQVWKDGKEHFFMPHAVAIRDAEGQLQGTTLILSDVTDLRRVDEMKSGLLSTVSHELRTPLTSLQMAVHVLLGEKLGELNKEQTELLVVARDDAERLREIVESLLELSRLQSDRQLLRFEPVAPREFVEARTNEFRPEFEDAGIELKVEIDPEAPKVLADPARARLVLSNLLSNALHHTPAGGSVTVRAERHKQYVRFSVADTGRGISPEYIDRIFDRFFQAPGTEDLGGAGLGLSIAKEIVHAHGGEIHVQSKVGAGTTFWFSLPVAPAADSTAA